MLRPGGVVAFCGEPSRYGDRIAALPKGAGVLLAPFWRRLVGASAVAVHPEDACDGHELEPEVDVHSFSPAELAELAEGAGFGEVRLRGEELLANAHGWLLRTLEATAEPNEVPYGWRLFAFRSYLALQRLDTGLLEPRLPPELFYNLVLSARRPAERVAAVSEFVSRGFSGRRRTPEELAERLPPGQYAESGFPVLTAGPTPEVAPDEWSFRIDGMVASEREWSWEEFAELGFETVPCDIHCVTTWSKLGTSFGGVSVDTLLEQAEPLGAYAMAFSYGGYTTNLPIEDLSDGRAWVVTEHEGEPLPREHGGPARLLVPHLYFWKSAKWVAGIRVMDHDEPGFWEANGYHNRGDPWKEERYWTD